MLEEASNSRIEAIRTSYEILGNEAANLVQSARRQLSFNGGSFNTRLNLIRAQAILFTKENRRQLFNVKAEIMRHAIMNPNAPKPYFNDSEFKPKSYSSNIQNFMTQFMLDGYEGLAAANTLHLSQNEVITFSDPNFMANLLNNISLTNYLTFFHNYMPDYEQEYLEINDEVAKESYSKVGIDTFAIAMTAVVSCLRKTTHIRMDFENSFNQVTSREGLLGQLMRMGSEVINNFTDQQIDRETLEFTNSAPIIISPEGGIFLDLVKALAMYRNIVNINDPSAVKVKGKLVCPADQMFNISEVEGLGEQDQMLLWMMKRIIEFTPDSYLTAA